MPMMERYKFLQMLLHKSGKFSFSNPFTTKKYSHVKVYSRIVNYFCFHMQSKDLHVKQQQAEPEEVVQPSGKALKLDDII